MNVDFNNYVISIKRGKSEGIGMVTTVIFRNYGFMNDDMTNTEKVRIMRDRKSNSWNLYFHKYDKNLSELLEQPVYEIKASSNAINVKGNLRDIISDIDIGMYSY